MQRYCFSRPGPLKTNFSPGCPGSSGPFVICALQASHNLIISRPQANGAPVMASAQAKRPIRLIIIDHGGGFQTYYAHLSKISVHAGQEVRRTDVIGLVGTSGRTTAPHLHYEVRSGGAPMNPYKYLANTSVFRQVPKDIPFQ